MSPDGKRMATIDDDTLFICDTVTGAAIAQRKAEDLANVAFSLDGTQIITGTTEGALP